MTGKKMYGMQARETLAERGPTMKVSTVLENAERSQFYGRIELEYKAGRITLIRRNQTILPEPEGFQDKGGQPLGRGEEEGA